MSYRKFDTGTWQDPWFENLDYKSKLAFVYFWTNGFCNQAGIYEISEKRILFDLGYGIDTISIPLHEKVIWYNDRKIVWIKNFFRHQCQNKNFAIGALNSVKKDSFKLQTFIVYNRDFLEGLGIDLKVYHIDTITIPYITEQNRTEQNRTDKEIKEPPTSESKKFKPPNKKKANPETSSGKFKPKKTDVKNNDFTVNLTNTFLEINKLCDKIMKLPKTSKRKKNFNPRQWSQKQINNIKHPGAIAKTLDGLIMYWDTSKDPWGYSDKMLSKLNGTFNEDDAIKVNEILKAQSHSGDIEKLTNGLFKQLL